MEQKSAQESDCPVELGTSLYFLGSKADLKEIDHSGQQKRKLGDAKWSSPGFAFVVCGSCRQMT